MESLQQVLSLNLAKRLNELGVKRPAYFNWCLHRKKWDVWNDCEMGEFQFEPWGEPPIAAYNVAELGEMLPNFVKLHVKVGIYSGSLHFGSKILRDKCTYALVMEKNSLGYSVQYRPSDTNFLRYASIGEPSYSEYDQSEANARAKMLVYLIENNIVQPGDL